MSRHTGWRPDVSYDRTGDRHLLTSEISYHDMCIRVDAAAFQRERLVGGADHHPKRGPGRAASMIMMGVLLITLALFAFHDQSAEMTSFEVNGTIEIPVMTMPGIPLVVVLETLIRQRVDQSLVDVMGRFSFREVSAGSYYVCVYGHGVNQACDNLDNGGLRPSFGTRWPVVFATQL